MVQKIFRARKKPFSKLHCAVQSLSNSISARVFKRYFRECKKAVQQALRSAKSMAITCPLYLIVEGHVEIVGNRVQLLAAEEVFDDAQAILELDAHLPAGPLPLIDFGLKA